MEPDDGSLDALDTLSRITPVDDPPDWADHRHMRGPGYHKHSTNRSVATEKSREPPSTWSDNIDQYIDNEFEADAPSSGDGDDDGDDDDLASLTSMDTETFRRLRKQRRSNYKSSDSHYREHHQRGGGGGGSSKNSTISSGGSSRLLRNGKQPRGGYSSSDTEVTKNSKSTISNNSSVPRRRNGTKNNGGRGHYTDGDIEDQSYYSHDSNSTSSTSGRTSVSPMIWDRILGAIQPSRSRSKPTKGTTRTSRRSKRSKQQSRFPWTVLLICLSFVGILKSGMVELKLEQNLLNTILRGSDAVDELNYRRNTYHTKPNVAAAEELEKVIDQMLEEDEDANENGEVSEGGEGKGIMDGGVVSGGVDEYSEAIMPAEDVDPPALVASPVVLDQQQQQLQQLPMQNNQLLPQAMGAIGSELQSNIQQFQVQQAVDPLLATNGVEQMNAINTMGQPQEQQTQEQLLQVQIQQLQLLQQQQQQVVPQVEDQGSASLQGDSLSSLPDLTPLLQPEVQKEPERLPSYHIPPERLPNYHIPQVFIQPQQPQQQDEVPLHEVPQVDQSELQEQQQPLSDVQQQQEETSEQFQQPEQQETSEQFQQSVGDETQPNLEQLDSNIVVQPNPEQLESNTDVQPDLTSFLHPNGAPKIMKRKATFIGCYADEKDRDLPIQLLGSGFTHEQCYQGCSTQGYAYFGMQYEGDCWCGNAYGKYGTTECVNDCSSEATFFGKWVNCVYGISTNSETPIENDPSLAKDESEIEPNTDNTNAISQEDSSANVDDPPSEVYFRQSLENVKNVNLNPKVQARNSNSGEEEEQIVGESDIDLLSADPPKNDSQITDEEKDQLNQEGASDAAPAEEGSNSNQEQEDDREEGEDDSQRQRNPKAEENRETRTKRVRRRKPDKEAVVYTAGSLVRNRKSDEDAVVETDGVDNTDAGLRGAKEDGAEEEEGNKGDAANSEGRNENTTEEVVVKEE